MDRCSPRVLFKKLLGGLMSSEMQQIDGDGFTRALTLSRLQQTKSLKLLCSGGGGISFASANPPEQLASCPSSVSRAFKLNFISSPELSAFHKPINHSLNVRSHDFVKRIPSGVERRAGRDDALNFRRRSTDHAATLTLSIILFVLPPHRNPPSNR